jgi:transposase-like protein
MASPPTRLPPFPKSYAGSSSANQPSPRLDPIVTAWNTRPLQGQRYPFVLVDALVLQIREDARGQSRSALMATGVNTAGYHEMLGLGLGDNEPEATGAACVRASRGSKTRGSTGWIGGSPTTTGA